MRLIREAEEDAEAAAALLPADEDDEFLMIRSAETESLRAEAAAHAALGVGEEFFIQIFDSTF